VSKRQTEPGEPAQPAEARSKTRLGKGLSALFGENVIAGDEAAASMRSVPVARIAANPFQPRREFDAAELEELAASIRDEGLMQPLVVRPAGSAAPEGAAWELIAGERRWRAVRGLGWTEVPVVVKDASDGEMAVLAIVENVQRADLSPIDQAAGYRRLVEEFGYTQQQVATRVKKPRPTVANLMRLLDLPASVQRLVIEQSLEVGAARALLGLGDERRIADMARQAVDEGWTVRDVEERVRAARPEAKAAGRRSAQPNGAGDAHLRHLETELQRALGTAARIRVGRGDTGRVEIPFYNADDFDRVIELLLGSEAKRL
jgi:ParB family transcriptional regulator, chromosome partitioning protein